MSNAHVMIVDVVGDLYERHGLWKIVRALVVAWWAKRTVRNHVSHLSERMRRDIGLAPEKRFTRPVVVSFWDVRL